MLLRIWMQLKMEHRILMMKWRARKLRRKFLESHMLNRVRTQHGESNPTSQQEQTTQTPASFQTESNPPSPQNEAQQVALAEEALKVLNDAKTNIKDKSKRAQKMADDLYKSQLISSDAKGTLIFRANELNR